MMKRIVCVINSLAVGGAQRLLVDDVNELFRRGYDVHLVTLEPSRGASLAPLLKIPRSAQHEFSFKGSRDVSALFALLRFFKKEKPDLVITHLWLANNVGRAAARWAGVRSIIAFEHSVYDGVKSEKQFFIDRVMQCAGGVVAISEAVKQSLVRHGIYERRIQVVPNGIDTQAYENPVCGPDPLFFESPGFMFTFVGRFIPAKAVDLLIEAFARLEKGTLCLAGDGPLRPALEALVKEKGIESRVRFLGVRDDIPCILKQAGCLVLPSRREGFGLVLLEAMAAGVPVIATSFDAAREIVENGKTGLIVPQEDAVLLSEAMKKIAENASLRKEIIERGKMRARDFSIEKHVEGILSFAQKLHMS